MTLVPELADIGALLYVSALSQSIIIFSIVTFLGLLLAPRAGFSLPELESKKGWKELVPILLPSVIWGVLCGILIVLGDFILQKLSVSLFTEEMHTPVWVAFIASFYGGIAEEVLMRLFLVSFIAWLASKFRKTEDGMPTNGGVWSAIIIASVLFGLGHLPFTGALTEITTVIVVRAIVLNGIGGVIFGWLYWKKGLVSAMIAHFSTDIVLHVVTPLLVKLF